MKFFGAPAEPTAMQPSTSSSQIASDPNLPRNNEIEPSGPVQILKSQSELSTQSDQQPDLKMIEVLAPSALISRLCNLAANLLASVPLSSKNEPLSCFDTSPIDSIPPQKDAWESVINPTLDHVIEFDKSTPEMASFIRHGPLGMDMFCNWIIVCIEDLGISTDILEEWLECIIEVMINWWVNQ